MLVALLVGSPEAVSFIAFALLALLPLLPAMVGARFNAWSRVQSRLWEAFHLLDPEDREVSTESSREGRATGRLGEVPFSVTMEVAYVVIARDGASCTRGHGERLTIVATTPPGSREPFAVRAEAPIDEDGDDWTVPKRECKALGPPFRAEREPPEEVMRTLRGNAGDALRRLVTFDEASKSGWRRLALSCSEGKTRLEAVAFGDADLADAFRLVAALVDAPHAEATEAEEPHFPMSAGSYRESARAAVEPAANDTAKRAPPLPPLPPATLFERLKLATLAYFSGGVWMRAAFSTMVLSALVIPLAPYAFAGTGTVVSDRIRPGDDDDGAARLLGVRVNGRRIEYRILAQVRAGAHSTCAAGSNVTKPAWSHDLACDDGGLLRIDSFSNRTLSTIAASVVLLLAFATWRRKYLEARDDDTAPPRLSWPGPSRRSS